MIAALFEIVNPAPEVVPAHATHLQPGPDPDRKKIGCRCGGVGSNRLGAPQPLPSLYGASSRLHRGKERKPFIVKCLMSLLVVRIGDGRKGAPSIAVEGIGAGARATGAIHRPCGPPLEWLP